MSGPTIVFAPVDSRDRYRAALPPSLQGLYWRAQRITLAAPQPPPGL